MEELVEQTKQLTNKPQLHARELKWISQLFDHIQQNISLDQLDPPPTVTQICLKIIDVIYTEYLAHSTLEENSKNFVLPVDSLLVTIAEIKSHTTTYCSNLNNLWHDNFFSYLSPIADRRHPSQMGVSSFGERSQYSLMSDCIPSSQSNSPRVKQVPAKPYLLIAVFVLTKGALGLPLLALRDNTGEVIFCVATVRVRLTMQSDPLRMDRTPHSLHTECLVCHHALDLHTTLHERGWRLH